jgi:hypothetical protein
LHNKFPRIFWFEQKSAKKEKMEEKITVSIVDQSGERTFVKFKRGLSVSSFLSRMETRFPLESYRFMYDGNRLEPEQTFEQLVCSNRLLTLRELTMEVSSTLFISNAEMGIC